MLQLFRFLQNKAAAAITKQSAAAFF